MRLIATGNTAEIFLRDRSIVKVYSRHSRDDVEHEARNQSYARSLGLPVPAVIEVTEVEGRPALVMEHAPGVPMKGLLEEQPDRMHELLARSVEIQREVHALQAPKLRSMKDRLAGHIRSVDQLTDKQKSRLILMMDDVGEEAHLCHGDLHVMNLMVDGNDVAIIDWMDATRGDVRLDACRTYVLYSEVDAGFAAAYLAEYCRQSGLEREEVLRWQPVIVGARLSESRLPSQTYSSGNGT